MVVPHPDIGSPRVANIHERMTITFETDNDVIVYALEKIISCAQDNHYIFVAQSVRWIASITALQQGLVIFTDNLDQRASIGLWESTLT